MQTSCAVSTTGTVTSDGDYVSGFVPKSEKTIYTACANNGAITGRTRSVVSALRSNPRRSLTPATPAPSASLAYGTASQAIGGLFAEIRYGSSITRSYNSGAVTGDCYVGGLVGTLSSSSDSTNGVNYIVDCYNSGAINRPQRQELLLASGGLVGNLDAGMRSYSQSYVHNCYNTGTVTDLGLKTAVTPALPSASCTRTTPRAATLK